jgi:glycosyltransferase involved in cell wall biosynthesis
MSKVNPTVSVIIPTRNRYSFVPRAIQSVLNQTYQDFEVLVVDDASDDHTEEIVKGFSDERITYIHHEVKRGGSAARNTGIKLSKGEFIAFLDDDDQWLPEKLQCQMHLFSNSPTVVGAIYTGVLKCSTSKDQVLKEIIPTKRGMIFRELLFSNCIATTSTILIKRECFEKVGLFDEKLSSCQDWDMWIRLSQDFQFDFTEHSLVKFYVHENSITTDYQARIQGRQVLLEKIFHHIASQPKLVANYYFENSRIFFLMNDRHKGKAEMRQVIKNYPTNIKYLIYFFYSLTGLNPFRPSSILKTIVKNSNTLTKLLGITNEQQS